MNSRPHRQNSDFQLRYFLAGSCTTPDGAYVLLYGQRVDMRDKVASADSQLKRRMAKIAKAQYIMDSETSLVHERLEAEADKLEVEAQVETWELNLKAAKQELKAIEDMMAELKPMCKHYNDDILVMSEASQQGEWLGELKQRAENFLLTAGTIPHDHFQTMRMHPQFKEELVPHIQMMHQKISSIGMKDYAGNLVGPANMAQIMLEMDGPQLLLAAPKEE